MFDETADGRQIYVYLWRLVDSSVRVPGVAAHPPTGSWYVSPGLQRAMATEPALAERYRGATLISPDGVASPQELLAYRFVGPETLLSESLVAVSAQEWIGDVGDAVDPFPLAVVTVGLIVVPGLGLLFAGVSPMLTAAERRLVVLTVLGAPPRARRAAWAMPVALAAVPGALAGAAAWLLLGPSSTTVPFVGRGVFAGDLGISPAEALVAAGAVSLLATAAGGIRVSARFGSRPSARAPVTPPASRLMPLLTSAALGVAGVLVPGRRGAELFLVGLVGASVGTVIALPWLTYRVGIAVAHLDGALPTLVGRRLARDAATSARSLLVVGALATLLPVVATWVGVNRAIDRPSPARSYAVEVGGALSMAEVGTLEVATGGVALRIGEPAESASSSFAPSIVGDCERLRHTTLARCDRDGRLAPVAGRGLDDLAGLEVSAAPPPGTRARATRFVAIDGPRTEQLLRRWVVNAAHPGIQVLVPGRALLHESPLVAWVLGASRLAAWMGCFALALHLMGLASRTGASRRRLSHLGCSPSSLSRIVGTEAALAVALVGGGSLAVGAMASALSVLRDPVATFPTATVVVIATAVAALAIGSGAMASAAARLGLE